MDRVVELPEDLPDGRALVAEGRRIGESTPVGVSAFCEAHGVTNEVEFRASQAAEGEFTWSTIMGLSSIDEEIEGLRFLDRMGRETGFPIHRALIIPNWLTGIPPEVRDKAPRGTSFILDGLEDHVRLAQAAPIHPCFIDHHIGAPHCVNNTAAAIQAGGTYHGVFADFANEYPLAKDAVKHISETIKAVGVVAAKRDDFMVVDSYIEDSIAAHFLDHVSTVGYAMIEKYIVDGLCGARYANGIGGLITDMLTKLSVCLALYEVTCADHPSVSYYYGSTLAPSDKHLVQNYGVIASEYALMAALERRYHMGLALLPTPITEKVEVPTKEGIADARMVAGRAADRSSGVDKVIDWGVIEAHKDMLVEHGKDFFANALRMFEESGVDVRDPLQMCLALRLLGAEKLESLCHPGERDPSRPNGIVPFMPTELPLMADEAVGMELAAIKAKGLAGAVEGRTFLVASADTHWFGAYAVKAVLTKLGAQVIDIGPERDPQQVVAAAEREDWPAIMVSLHNGQCAPYGEQLMTTLAESGARCPVYFGGKLNGIRQGDTEPSDMSDDLRKMGIIPCMSVAEMVEVVAGGASP